MSRYTALHFTASPSPNESAAPHRHHLTRRSLSGCRSAATVNAIASVVNSARKTSSIPTRPVVKDTPSRATAAPASAGMA